MRATSREARTVVGMTEQRRGAGRWWRSLTVRITLLATAATAVVLVAVMAGVLALFDRQLAGSADDGLRARLGYLSAGIADDGPSAVVSEALAELSDRGRPVAVSAVLSPPGAGTVQLVDPDPGPCTGPPVFSRRTVPVVARREPLQLRVLAGCLPDGRVLAVAVSLQPQEEAREHLLLLLALASPILLSVVSLTVGRAIHGALGRVDLLTRQAAQITEGRHVAATWEPIPGNDEIARLARTFEAMLARLAVAFAREQAFVDEASHELRTPIAVLRGEVELALSDLADTAGVEQSLRAALAEAERLSRLVEDLLGLARDRTDSAPRNGQRADLAVVLTTTAERLQRTSTVTLEVVAAADLQVGLTVTGVERILANLVSNAAAAGASRVLVTAARSGEGALLEVHDDGPGFPAAFLPSAFQRFSRADPARTRSTGAGLGLALVATLVGDAGGRVAADNRSQLGGAAVRLWLPGFTP